MDSSIAKNQPWAKTFKHACDGCRYAFKTQRNFKVHLLLAVIAIVGAILLEFSLLKFLLLSVGILFGLVVEMVNTAIEKTVDLVTCQYHPTAKIAKDVAAGAMLIASFGLFLLAVLLFVPPLWKIIFVV